MRDFICIYDRLSRLTHSEPLNIRQLLNPIFFEHERRHPDMKRQRSRRQRSKDLKAARELKAQRYVPLYLVPPPEQPVGFFRGGVHSYGWRDAVRYQKTAAWRVKL
jgi:hypothetical protein